MKISDDHFRAGQAYYQRGVGLRDVAAQTNTLDEEGKEDESMSLLLGYLDGVVASIRRTDNLLLMPAGPDK